MVMVYCTKRMQIKLSKGKKWKEQSQGDSRNELPILVSPEVIERHLISQQHVARCMKYCQRGNLTLSLGRGFYWGLVQQAQLIAHVTDFSYLTSSNSRGQTHTVWPKFPTINHIVSGNSLACPRPHVCKHTLNRQDILWTQKLFLRNQLGDSPFFAM